MAQRTHLPQLEEHPRVVPARDLVQEVIHQLLAVAPGILHKLLQAGRGRERTGWKPPSVPTPPRHPPPQDRLSLSATALQVQRFGERRTGCIRAARDPEELKSEAKNTHPHPDTAHASFHKSSVLRSARFGFRNTGRLRRECCGGLHAGERGGRYASKTPHVHPECHFDLWTV